MRKCIETNRITVYGCLSHNHLCYSTTLQYMHICVVKSTIDPLLIRFMLKTTRKCTSFLILGTNTYNKLTIYLLLILISELLEYDIVKYVVLSIVCIIRCYVTSLLL